MTPQQRRAGLIAAAKSLAVPVVSCVHARLRPDHLLSGLGCGQLAALVIVLAEAADPAAVREIAAAPGDDGRPDPAARTAMLRKAHAQAQALRKAGRIPAGRLAILDREYYRDYRRRLREAAAADRRAPGGDGQPREGEAAA